MTTVRLVEWFLQTKLPEFQNLQATPSIEDLGELFGDTFTMDGWSGPLPTPVIEAFIEAFPMLLDASEELNWDVLSCPCQEISPLTTKYVFLSLFQVVMGSD